jgi:hypothetical protein
MQLQWPQKADLAIQSHQLRASDVAHRQATANLKAQQQGGGPTP